jgi:hypothetical protein
LARGTAHDSEEGAVTTNHTASVTIFKIAAGQFAIPGELGFLNASLPRDEEQFVRQLGRACFIGVIDKS